MAGGSSTLFYERTVFWQADSERRLDCKHILVRLAISVQEWIASILKKITVATNIVGSSDIKANCKTLGEIN
jgi:hypothetical protein